MSLSVISSVALALLPFLSLYLVLLLNQLRRSPVASQWRVFVLGSVAASLFSLVNLLARLFWGANLSLGVTFWSDWLYTGLLGAWLAVLVQVLGVVVGSFSRRYLVGEEGQSAYIRSLTLVLLAVNSLLLANHWVLLIGAWSLVGFALRPLLLFYSHRPFARLAAHKKRAVDVLADLLLIVAAACAWLEVGSGSLNALTQYLGQSAGTGFLIQISALCLVFAVALRTALLPIHGWVTQVMEAPTPVSALLHAGVVNLGGFVLIRFASLLEAAPFARALLLVFGVLTAVLGAMVMLTRVSIKVRLAWSTIAQMGFMVVECALGLYTFAAVHLIGHSLYKVYAFLSASSVVRESQTRAMAGQTQYSSASMWLAPCLAAFVVFTSSHYLPGHLSPWWWDAALALAWAPILWLPKRAHAQLKLNAHRLGFGLLAVFFLTFMLIAAQWLPLGLVNQPSSLEGLGVLCAMFLLYALTVAMHGQSALMQSFRRACYAGFYLDEMFTRVVLLVWPSSWAPAKNKRPLEKNQFRGVGYGH